MALEVTFGEHKLTDWITVLSGFTLFNGADFDVTTTDYGGNGSVFVDTKFKSKTIKVPFFAKFPTVQSYDDFMRILAVKEPQKLIFSNFPDRYFLAIPKGEFGFAENRKEGKGTITFIVPDGTAHARAYKRITDYREENGHYIFDIENNGTAEAYPIIKVKTASENGYVGLVNSTGITEIGDKEEADEEPREKSEMLFKYTEGNQGIRTGLNNAVKNQAILNDTSQRLDSVLTIENMWGREHMRLGQYSRGSGNHAGSATWNIGGGLYDYIWWRQIFWVGLASQGGFIKIMVSDENNQFLYGVETIKRSNGLNTEYNFLVTDGHGGYNIKERWTFNATHRDEDNPFNHTRGWSDLTRSDDNVSIYWFGSQFKRNYPELKGKKSMKLHVAIGTVGGYELGTHIYLDGINYRKDKIPFMYDIPNAFSQGSEVVINCQNDTVTIDGILKLNSVVNGSDFLKIPVGHSTLEAYFSTWVTQKPQLTIEFEERYL